jgi:uncharacterized Fe-S center protein
VLIELLERAALSSMLRKDDFVGIKLHFGEKGNKSHIPAKVVRPLAEYLIKFKTKPFLFDTNTLYRGMRTNSVDHLTQASRHGFGAAGVPLIIADGLTGNDYTEVAINKKHYATCYLASLWKDIDFIFCFSHFTLHMLTGFGASLKNMGMGIASRRGKLAQHCQIAPHIDQAHCVSCGECAATCLAQCITKTEKGFFIQSEDCIGCAQCISVCPVGAVKIDWSIEHSLIQERMVEYAYAAASGKRCAYCNLCIFITRECDCMNKEESGYVNDVGIFFGYDPVAVDKASVDAVCAASKDDPLRQVHPQIDYTAQFSYAESIGLGSCAYTLRELT